MQGYQAGVLLLSRKIFHPTCDVASRQSQNKRKNCFQYTGWQKLDQEIKTFRSILYIFLCKNQESLYARYEYYQENINEQENSISISGFLFLMLNGLINLIMLPHKFIPLRYLILLVKNSLMLFKQQKSSFNNSFYQEASL